jgi:LuxR family maltose regulon positive regulatory protein
MLAYTIRGLALKAFALQSSGKQELALTALWQALHIAENEGFVRTFIDLGQTMERLLKTGLPPQLAGYGKRLLSAFPNRQDPAVIAAAQANTQLPDPLTSRELEILHRIAAGHDNETIANAFTISIHTVKKHVTHLFEKLGVENRLQAVELARRLGLLF